MLPKRGLHLGEHLRTSSSECEMRCGVTKATRASSHTLACAPSSIVFFGEPSKEIHVQLSSV